MPSASHSMITGLPSRLAAEQLDAILGMVDSALRARLESRVMEHHEYRSELFRGIFAKGAEEGRAEGRAEGEAEGKAEGKAKGKAEGKADSILTVLAARGIPVSKPIRAQIRGCTDLKTLDQWLRRALTAATATAVVRAQAQPTPERSAAKRPAPKRAPAKRAATKRAVRRTAKK